MSMSKATETCPICHEIKQHVTFKYCDRCRERLKTIVHTRDIYGNTKNINTAREMIRKELGIVQAVQGAPIPQKQPECCPCPEYGTKGANVCMFPRRRDGTCPKMDGFKTKRHEWV